MVQTQSSLSFSLQIVKSRSKTSISSQNLGHPPLFSKCFIYISKLGAFSLVCQWVRISSLKHVSIITPNNIDLQSHPSFSKISLLFHILLIRENSQSLHLFNCLRRIQPYKLQEKCKYIYKGLMTLIPSK